MSTDFIKLIKRSSWRKILVRSALILTITKASAHAETLGVLSFNTFIASTPGLPGVNDFEIDDFTGAFALPPDFSASTSLAFDDASLVLTLADGSTRTVLLGDLGAGSSTPLSLQFSALTSFKAAQFTATLSQNSFLLTTGSTVTATSDQLDVVLDPGVGATLIADTDFALIDVANSSTATPEPNVFWAGLGVLALVVLKQRSRSLPR